MLQGREDYRHFGKESLVAERKLSGSSGMGQVWPNDICFRALLKVVPLQRPLWGNLQISTAPTEGFRSQFAVTREEVCGRQKSEEKGHVTSSPAPTRQSVQYQTNK